MSKPGLRPPEAVGEALRASARYILAEGRGAKVFSAPSYVALQIVSVVPLLFPVAGAALVSAFRARTDANRLLLFLGLPLLVFFFFVGITRSTHAFWPLPAWIPLSLLMADHLTNGGGRIAGFYRARWRVIASVSIVVADLDEIYPALPESAERTIDLRHGGDRVCV